uniref:Uncharacterized protein n=1 Tax=Arundo donax TaxID=35708 RepID=A0A0A9B1H9_ARUDO
MFDSGGEEISRCRLVFTGCNIQFGGNCITFFLNTQESCVSLH